MVIFLSTGMLQELSAELISGGYRKDAPAAIVYKATWPEEKVLHCTVGTLAETAERARDEDGADRGGESWTVSMNGQNSMIRRSLPGFAKRLRTGAETSGEEDKERTDG